MSAIKPYDEIMGILPDEENKQKIKLIVDKLDLLIDAIPDCEREKFKSFEKFGFTAVFNKAKRLITGEEEPFNVEVIELPATRPVLSWNAIWMFRAGVLLALLISLYY